MPDCDGKQCGPDGCDGLCGECPMGEPCVDGACFSPTIKWQKSFGEGAIVSEAAFTSDGGVVVGGGLKQGYTVNFGGEDLASIGGNDIWLARFDQAGNHIWSKKWGTEKLDGVNGLAVRADGGVIMAGYFSGTTIDFGCGPLQKTATKGSASTFATRLNPDGECLYSWGIPKGSAWPNEVVLDSAGSVFVVGYSQFDVDFGAGPSDDDTGNAGFVLKLSSQLGFVWVRLMEGDGNNRLNAVAPLTTGGVYVGGSFTGEHAFLNGEQVANSLAGEEDIVLAHLDSDGNTVWWASYGAEGKDIVWDLSVRQGDEGVAVGTFGSETVDFDGKSLSLLFEKDIGYPDSTDAFVIGFSSGQEVLWANAVGGSKEEYGVKVGLTPQFNIMAGYSQSSSLSLWGELYEDYGEEAGDFYPFLAATDIAGTPIWAKAFEGKASAYAFDAAETGAFALCGNVGSHVDFGEGELPEGHFVALFQN
jgi:hypothetical protein